MAIHPAHKIKNAGCLLLTALIWGVAFCAQSAGGDAVGPYAFNCLRSIIGGMALVVVLFVMDRVHPSEKKPKTKKEQHRLLAGGIACGAALFCASTLQQIGIYMGAPAGKAGFLTACYILFVPLLGLFFKKACKWNIWVAVLIALVGLYLLCINGEFCLQPSDILLLLCALVFSIHILIIDHFSPLVDGVRMSCIQFFVCGALGIVPMVLIDWGHSMEGLKNWLQILTASDAWVSLLYAGVMSSGVGYTLQIVGQKGVHPTAASLILSLESVFSVLAGWVLLHEAMSGRELAGCGLIFGAVVLAQLPADFWKRT